MGDIVKVQVDTTGQRLFIYNEDMSIMYETEDNIEDAVALLPAPKLSKAYFNYHMNGEELVLDEEVEGQDW